MVQLRSPTIWGYEYEALADGGKDWDARRFEAFVGEYTRRQTEVTKFRIELGALFLECEALWDNTLDELFKSVFGLEHEFTMYLYLHLRIINPAFDEFSKQKYQSMIGTRRNVLYNTTGNDDEFQAELNGYLEKMQTYLKEKLVT
ncbi:hypothetical protein PMI35_01168 [Pseudomonas sp. GM78]|nr:hypothetical protein PMI35_01168 [Pseudomonas sp. GM78]